MILATREERLKLLKSGYTEKQIEALYIDLNRFEIVIVNWDGAATKRTGRILHNSIPSFQNLTFRPTYTADFVRVIAAPPRG